MVIQSKKCWVLCIEWRRRVATIYHIEWLLITFSNNYTKYANWFKYSLESDTVTKCILAYNESNNRNFRFLLVQLKITNEFAASMTCMDQ